MKINIFGYGTVGNATHNLLAQNPQNEIRIIDPALNKNFANRPFQEGCSVICVNAPENSHGHDLTNLRDCFKELVSYSYAGLVIIKTTILPEQVELLQKEWMSLDICTWPEFLSEYKSHDESLLDFQVFGGNTEQFLKFKTLFKSEMEFITLKPSEAMALKIARNLFCAVKVSFWHSIFKDNFTNLRSVLHAFEKLEQKFPQGNCNQLFADGKFGFGGKCIPKDLNAYLSCFNNPILKKIQGFNNSNRPKID